MTNKHIAGENVTIIYLTQAMKPNKPIAIDAFSGCGGLTTGLKQAGFNVIGAIEIDPKARDTYSMNHPKVPLLGTDIRELKSNDIFRQLKLKRGDLDLLAGCPPCQGFSSIRRRNKSAPVFDERNNLIDEFSRLAEELFPKFIMMENVPGLKMYEKFDAFIQNLNNLGYQIKTSIKNVADYGVPQRRLRLIMCASRIGDPVDIEPLSKKITVRSAFSKLGKAGNSGDSLHDYKNQHSDRILNLIASIPKDGGSRSSIPENLQLECHKKTTGFNDVYGRMKWNDVSPTITSGCTNPSKGRFLHPEENRAITLREAALLQGFPKSYKFNLKHGKSAISLMIGNALPPPFIAQHAIAIRKNLNEKH